MVIVHAQARLSRSRAHRVLGFVITVGILCWPQNEIGTWAAQPGQSPLRCSWDETTKKELKAPLVLDDAFGAILLCIEVNGMPARVVLDTGSNVTVVSVDLIHPNHTNLTTSVTPLKGSGYVSTGHWGEANLHLGDRYWVNRRILVDEMQTLSQAHRQRIDGILGRDILKEFRFVIIDYEHKVFTLGSR